MSTCDRLDEIRDYALDELTGSARRTIEEHISGCGECASELDRLRVTTSALRILPDREIPQRIAFVSDKVFKPSPFARWFGGFWNSAARLGFASACVLSAALIVIAYHRPAEVRIATGPTTADISKQVNDAVAKAVTEVRAEDTRMTEAAVAASDRKHEKEYRALMVAVQENMTVLEKNYTTLAYNDSGRSGAGQ